MNYIYMDVFGLEMGYILKNNMKILYWICNFNVLSIGRKLNKIIMLNFFISYLY